MQKGGGGGTSLAWYFSSSFISASCFAMVGVGAAAAAERCGEAVGAGRGRVLPQMTLLILLGAESFWDRLDEETTPMQLEAEGI